MRVALILFSCARPLWRAFLRPWGLAVGLWLGALAPTLGAPPESNFLPLAQQSVYALRGHMDVLADPSGQLGIADVAQVDALFDAFVPLPGELIPGHVQGALWLRINAWPAYGAPASWVLTLDNAFIDDVQLYLPRAGGQFERVVQGALHPQDVHKSTLHSLMFPVAFAQHTPGPLYLRLQSRGSLSSDLHFWQLEELQRRILRDARRWGLYFGISLMVPCLFFVFWWLMRNPLHGWYALYVALGFVVVLLDRGWIQRPLLGPWYAYANAVVTVVVALTFAVMQQFESKFLNLAQHFPRGNRAFLWGSYLVAALTTGLVLAGELQRAMQWLPLEMLPLMLVSTGMALALLRRPEPQARIFLWAFGFFYIGLLARIAHLMGWAHLGWLSHYGYQLGALWHMAILSGSLLYSYRQMQRATEQAQRQVAVEQQLRAEQRDFMAMISHEFRTPLGVISAATDNLACSPGLSDADLARCAKIQRASERLRVLMDNYLSSERLEFASAPPHTAPLNLTALCHRVMEAWEGLPGPAVVCTRTAPLWCEGDGDLLYIALHNLLENARRHTAADKPIAVHLEEDAQHVTLQVCDAGVGIPEDELPLLFKRYFRGRNAIRQPGAGLGLYLAAQIAQRHGGTLSVQSRLGVGSTFSLVWPKQGPAARP